MTNCATMFLQKLLSPCSKFLYPVMCFTKWWTSPCLCLWMTEPLSIQFWYHELLIMNMFACGMFQTLCCPCPKLSEASCWHEIQNKHTVYILFVFSLHSQISVPGQEHGKLVRYNSVTYGKSQAHCFPQVPVLRLSEANGNIYCQ